MFRATTLLVLLGSSVQGFSPSLLKSSPRHARSTAVNVEATEAAVSTGPSLATKLGKQAQVDQLKASAPDGAMTETQLLRFAMAFDDMAEAKAAVASAAAWRKGEGKGIVDAAAAAVAKATSGGGWDNGAVRDAAPHAAALNEFITPKNILTMAMDSGDLVYIIRASAIDDNKMMSKVSVKQVSDFFAYVKEVHSIVADARSERLGRVCEVIFANDISGIRSPPNADFSKALSSSSKQYEGLYPSLAGPTMILNLPFVLQAFVSLFKPLFPKTVQARLNFEKAPVLASFKELTPLSSEGRPKEQFLGEVNRLLKK